jgi:hypothetical protein
VAGEQLVCRFEDPVARARPGSCVSDACQGSES